ncbi:MAG: winged helix-turn-helix transcriptional regulator [Dehalococcoidia bacterium]|nr:winged helix-turn-helix transcriptional regulator [Dehalococcoidia bacterium]
MRPQGCEAELLRALAAMPFLDRLEMVAVTGWSRGPVYEAAARLEAEGFCASALHATDILPPSRRFYLTAKGLRRLADEEDVSSGELVRSRPLSAQWRRSLMERMDALAAVYHVAAVVANVEYPIAFRWYRAMPMDAAMTLPDGRTIGVVRQGLTADRSGFAKRIWRMRDEPTPGVVLMLMADHVRLRHARRLFSTTRIPALFAVEREAVLSKPGHRIWSPSAVGASLDLRYVLDRLEPGGELPVETEPQRADLPADVAIEGPDWDISDPMLPFMLKPAEKRALDAIADWPWIGLGELAGLMGVSPQRASQLVNPLEGFDLAVRPRDVGGRLAVTDRGLALLSRRDRTSVALARKRWSVSLEDADAPMEWRNVSGTRSRQLLRNMEHTASVHVFVGALAAQAPLLGWEVVQLDPPRRASRHFRHEGGMRSVNPDAFGVLKRGETTWPFFLEWERRAVRPSTMSQRLAPYLRYYSSHRPADDHGTQPAVLVVFDDEIAQTHFLRVAREEMRAEGATVPLWVSHKGAVEALGPLGRAWRVPGDWESPQAPTPL